MRYGILRAGAAAAVISAALAASPALAQQSEEQQIKALQTQLVRMQAELDALRQQVAAKGGPATGPAERAPQTTVAEAPARAIAPAAQPASPETLETSAMKSAANEAPPAYRSGKYIERKPGKTLTLFTSGGEITAYGNFDISVDEMSKGIAHLVAPDGSHPVGRLGWQPDISTNLSFIGVRGFQALSGNGLSFIYQLEAQIDISSSSGVAETNSNQNNVVKSGLTSRNSYIGLASDRWGAISIGKTDTPYKQSTIRMNPFVGMIGDYGAIMGNTGGDNRVEFGTRLDHSIWYESPQVHGLKFNILFSPGQNRSSTSDNIAAGESDCTGGNIPGSGGSLPVACNDGSFSNALSTSLSYANGPLYLVAAYERHGSVNRQSDLTGLYANPPAALFAADVADEDAFKVGAQLTLPTQTTVSGIVESLHRYVPSSLDFQNERQRAGAWVSLVQQLDRSDRLAVGWAHAFRTPGDPGQHNTSIELPPLGQPGDAVGGAHQDNTANLFSVALIHDMGGGLSTYVNWAAIYNGAFGHYALGAGGRPITADCHDASDASGGLASDPHCWAGGHPMGLSTGLRYHF